MYFSCISLIYTCALTHDQMALYMRTYVNICIWDIGKGYGIIYAPPPDQLVYVDDVAHNGRDDMMGCPQWLDDIMYIHTYTWNDIYTHVHDIINVLEL